MKTQKETLERTAANILSKTIPEVIEQFLFEPKTHEVLSKIGRRLADNMYKTGHWDDARANFNPVIPRVNLSMQYTKSGIDVNIRFPNVHNLRFSV